jgi:hypothetical protein
VCPVSFLSTFELTPSLATSTDVERVSSRGCILLSHICNHFSAQRMHAIISLGSWSLLGLIQDANIFYFNKLLEEPVDPKLEAEEWEAIFPFTDDEDLYNNPLNVDYD